MVEVGQIWKGYDSPWSTFYAEVLEIEKSSGETVVGFTTRNDVQFLEEFLFVDSFKLIGALVNGRFSWL